MKLNHILYPLLLKLPAEGIHNITLKSLSKCPRLIPNHQYQDPCQVMGLNFPNRLGLGAGLDKNGIASDAFARMGFGFIEVGTVTPRVQAGNPKPRLFRLPESQAIINRMGFNNLGVDNLCKNIAHFRSKHQTVLGINLGKNKDTANENAIDDYLYGMNQAYQYADYLTINISSPNTAGLRDLQQIQALSQLLQSLKEKQALLAEQQERYVPLVVKIAPDLDDDQLTEMLSCFKSNHIDGVIATNTTIDKSTVAHLKYGNETGGLSGTPLTQRSTAIIKSIRQQLPDIAIIASGGVMNRQDYQDKLNAGADLVQIYTGFIYQGPQIIKNCLEG